MWPERREVEMSCRDGESARENFCGNWLGGLWEEIKYRWQMVVHAPSRTRVRQMENERIFREQHRLAEEYSQGYLDGWHECYSACLDAVEDELGRKKDFSITSGFRAGPNGSLKAN